MQLIDHIAHEHKDLLPQIEHLKDVADQIGVAADADLRAELQAAHHFLAHQLIPHAISEDQVLYPLVARYMNSTGATDLMSYEHSQVGALTQQLESLMSAASLDYTALRNTLYSLHALVLQHFNKEEKFFLPVLQDKLTPEDDDQAAKAMHEVHDHQH